MKTQFVETSPRELHMKMRDAEGAYLVDVRTPAEFADGHAEGALSIPVGEISAGRLRSRLGARAGSDQPVHLICASGLRAEQAAKKLASEGVENLVLVKGGTDAWSRQNLPTKRAASALLSLERQTQIALGVLIMLMLAKGLLLHPLFYAFLGLLGVGLIVAGVTARCGLSALLARMPWNRNPLGGATSSA